MLSQFGNERRKARERYREFVLQGIGKEAPWKDLKGQVFLGSDQFIEEVRCLTEEKKSLNEIPRTQRFAARQSLQILFPKGIRKDLSLRNMLIRSAYLEHGYTQKEIGNHLGLHPNYLSRIIKSNG